MVLKREDLRPFVDGAVYYSCDAPAQSPNELQVSDVVRYVYAWSALLISICIFFLSLTTGGQILLTTSRAVVIRHFLHPQTLPTARLLSAHQKPLSLSKAPKRSVPFKSVAVPVESIDDPFEDPNDPDLLYEKRRQVIAKRMVEGAVLGALDAALAMELGSVTAGAAEVAIESAIGSQMATTVVAAEVAGPVAAVAVAGMTSSGAGAAAAANTAVSLVGGYIMAFGTGSLKADMVAGIIAVILATIITHPLDTMKSRLQAGKKSIGSQGFRGLYHGLRYSISKKCPETSIYIAIYHSIREALLKRALNDASVLGDVFVKCMIVSSVAGAIAASIIKAPFEIINRKMQIGNITHAGEVFVRLRSDPLTRIYFFVSWMAVMLRDIPKGGLQFGVVYILELLGHTFLASSGVPVFFQRMIYAAIAGATAAFLTTPLDVISLRIMTRLQEDMQRIRAERDAEDVPETGEVRSPPVVEGLKAIFAEIWREGGIFGFWRGALLRTVSYVPGNCIFYAVFETLAQANGH